LTDETTEAPTEERKPTAAVPERNGMHLGEPAYKGYSQEMVKLIKQSIMPIEATDADLYYLLEMAATYKLDPFAKEIWAVKMPGKNAGKSGVVIMVGRDGMLAIAERNPDFRGLRKQAVYENDSFTYTADPREMPDGTFSHVKHEFSVIGDRGKLLGAWCEVYRHGRPPYFFFAPIEEYAKGGDYSPWQKQRSVMIEKCAIATALRLAYRISGLYLADEMTNALLVPPGAQAVQEFPAEAMMNLGDEPTLARWLLDLFDAAAKLWPQEFLPGKQRLLLAALDDDGRLDFAVKLQTRIYETTAELIERPTAESLTDDETVDEAEVEIVG
jgi:phage recombination protein Bet